MDDCLSHTRLFQPGAETPSPPLGYQIHGLSFLTRSTLAHYTSSVYAALSPPFFSTPIFPRPLIHPFLIEQLNNGSHLLKLIQLILCLKTSFSPLKWQISYPLSFQRYIKKTRSDQI